MLDDAQALRYFLEGIGKNEERRIHTNHETKRGYLLRMLSRNISVKSRLLFGRSLFMLFFNLYVRSIIYHLRTVRHPFLTKRALFSLDILFRTALFLFIAGCARRPAFRHESDTPSLTSYTFFEPFFFRS